MQKRPEAEGAGRLIMTWDIVITIGIAAAAVVLFATEKLRMDAVALLVLTSLALLGQVNTEEAQGG